MPDVDRLLEALRPAHMPPAAAGLTFGDVALPVALGLVLALAVALLWPRRIRGRRRIASGAIAELRRARALPAEDARLLQARLLRRVVAARDGPEAAALGGADFATHLDRTFATDFFTKGAGRGLVAGLYEPAAGDAVSGDAVADQLERFFSRVRA